MGILPGKENLMKSKRLNKITPEEKNLMEKYQNSYLEALTNEQENIFKKSEIIFNAKNELRFEVWKKWLKNNIHLKRTQAEKFVLLYKNFCQLTGIDIKDIFKNYRIEKTIIMCELEDPELIKELLKNIQDQNLSVKQIKTIIEDVKAGKSIEEACVTVINTSKIKKQSRFDMMPIVELQQLKRKKEAEIEELRKRIEYLENQSTSDATKPKSISVNDNDNENSVISNTSAFNEIDSDDLDCEEVQNQLEKVNTPSNSYISAYHSDCTLPSNIPGFNKACINNPQKITTCTKPLQNNAA